MPDSYVRIQVDRFDENALPTFSRMFWSLSAMKNGFITGCRPIIGLDGCFLKSPFGGQLLSAIGRDGNDNIFPIALAVVESKRYDSWFWFLIELRNEIRIGNATLWNFILNRQKGLINAIGDVFPYSQHRYCVRHIYQNFKQKSKGKELSDSFRAAASAGNVRDFKRAMIELESVDPRVGNAINAAGWLQKIPPHLWSRAYFTSACKSEILVNNLNESFNNYILPARSLPIISMFEWIRRKLMQRIQVKKSAMERYKSKICPNIQERLEKHKVNSRMFIAEYSGDSKWEVDGGTRVFVVDLQANTCTCGLFQLTGIPCPHAVAAIQKDHRPAEEFVDNCYSKDVYLCAYSSLIRPIPSMHYWDEFPNLEQVKPPLVRKQAGRPKKMRKRGADEPRTSTTSTRKGLTVHCKRCFRSGHNSRGCKYPIHPNSKFYREPEGATTSNGSALVDDSAQAGSQTTTAAQSTAKVRPAVAGTSTQHGVSSKHVTTTSRHASATSQPTASTTSVPATANTAASHSNATYFVPPGLDPTVAASNTTFVPRRLTRPPKPTPTVASVLEKIRANNAKRARRG